MLKAAKGSRTLDDMWRSTKALMPTVGELCHERLLIMNDWQGRLTEYIQGLGTISTVHQQLFDELAPSVRIKIVFLHTYCTVWATNYDEVTARIQEEVACDMPPVEVLLMTVEQEMAAIAAKASRFQRGKKKGKSVHPTTLLNWAANLFGRNNSLPIREPRLDMSSPINDKTFKRLVLEELRRKMQRDKVFCITTTTFEQTCLDIFAANPRFEQTWRKKPMKDRTPAARKRLALKWLHALGFTMHEFKKVSFSDGHERPDVVRPLNPKP